MADAEQEVYLELLRSLGRFRFDCSFRTYLYRITHNRGVDRLRRIRRRRRREEATGHRPGACAADPAAGGAAEEGADPVEMLLRRERAECTRRALARLAPAERSLLWLREAEGLSLAEIAATLGVPEGTVKSRLFRARERFAGVWEEMKG